MTHRRRDWALVEDLETVALHEAGHQEIARLFGVEGEVEIWPNFEAALDDDKCWHGRFWFRSTPTIEQRRALALSGSLAEFFAVEHRFFAPSVLLRLQSGAIPLSESDAALAEGFDIHDVELTCRLVIGAWPLIVASAQRLFDEHLARHLEGCCE